MMLRRLLAVATALAMIPAAAFASGDEETTESMGAPEVWFYGDIALVGEWTDEMMPDANQWLEDNFGFRMRHSSRPEGSSADEGLQLLVAQGQMPHVIKGVNFFTLSDFATQGRLLELDKYFDDPTNYPVYAQAEDSFMAKYVVNGRIMAIPGPGWPIDVTGQGRPIIWHSNVWIQRLDILEAIGEPTTHDEMLEAFRAVRDGDFPDLEGEQPARFGSWGFRGPNPYRSLIYSLKGAGWEVDAQKRLMPAWASEETRDAFAYLNLLWREGHIWDGQFFTDVGKFYGMLQPASLAYAMGGTHLASLMHSTKENLRKEHGLDSAIAQEAIAKQHVSLAPPVQDKPGRIHNQQPGPLMISKDTPVPDNVIAYLHWGLTPAGYLTGQHQSGLEGVHWDFTGDDLIWSLRPEYAGANPQTPYGDDKPDGISFSWCAAKDHPECQPKYAVLLNRYSQPSYAAVEHMFPLSIEDAASKGHAVGLDGGPAWAPRMTSFQPKWAEVTFPIPSYASFTEKLPPLEESAIISADERINNAVVHVITAESEAQFDERFGELMNSLIKLADWRSIYNARHQRWVDWITANDLDDRDRLHTVTPLPEWRAVMGW